jgi:hypothetical protein
MGTVRGPIIGPRAPPLVDPDARSVSTNSPSLARFAQPKACAMHSWIFRHRLRLLQIYGRVTPPALPGARFAPAKPAEVPTGGAVERAGKYVVVRPMPRAAR